MENINSQEFIERMKARNIHLNNIETAIKVEAELSNSTLFPLIIEVANSEADDALAELATVDPSNSNKIIALQGKIYRAKMLSDTLIAIRERGLSSMAAIQENGEEINGEEER